MKTIRETLQVGALAVLTLLSAACDSFLDVKNPNTLEAENIDADRDAALLSRSAFQAFTAQYGALAVYTAWFSNEARVGDTFPTRNDFGKRDIPLDSDQSGLWNSMHNAISYADRTAEAIKAAGNTVDLARAYFTSGYGMLLEGVLFCQATVPVDQATPGVPITSAAVLDSAIARLTQANTIAKALTTNTEAQNIAAASMVGLARASLQLGRKTQASQFAAQVPAAFVFNLQHFDDPANRGRLGNTVWSYSESRISLVVSPEYRAMADAGDPRIAYVDMKRPAQDGVLNFFRQAKYTGWASPERLASGLEAQYIQMEADANPAAMLAFINTRRAVGRQTPMAATTDITTLMKELMEQKGRDFFLETQKQGDFRRLGSTIVPYIIPPGNNYYKQELGIVGTQNCWPVPGSEIRNNPNWPK